MGALSCPLRPRRAGVDGVGTTLSKLSWILFWWGHGSKSCSVCGRMPKQVIMRTWSATSLVPMQQSNIGRAVEAQAYRNVRFRQPCSTRYELLEGACSVLTTVPTPVGSRDQARREWREPVRPAKSRIRRLSSAACTCHFWLCATIRKSGQLAETSAFCLSLGFPQLEAHPPETTL